MHPLLESLSGTLLRFGFWLGVYAVPVHSLPVLSALIRKLTLLQVGLATCSADLQPHAVH